MRRVVTVIVCVLLALTLLGCGSKAPFVASKNGSKFHKPSCPWAEQIHDQDKLGFQTRDAAIKAGYAACSSCNP
jgi:micrococcal nuclease